MVKLTEIKSRIEAPRAWSGREGAIVLNGYRVSVGDNERFLEMDSGDGRRTFVNALNAPESYT